MTGEEEDQAIALLGKDLEAGDWFWDADDPEHGYTTIHDLVVEEDRNEPFLVRRGVHLSNVWCVPFNQGTDEGIEYRLFLSEADAKAFFQETQK